MKFLLPLLLFISLGAKANVDNVQALKLALDDEYKAKATYLQVMDDFGQRRPFSNIVNSEQRHIEALLPFFDEYGIAVPDNPYIGKIPSYESFQEACQVGVAAEIENVKLYDKIFAMTDNPRLIEVFENLQWASQNRHLRAFRRCAR